MQQTSRGAPPTTTAPRETLNQANHTTPTPCPCGSTATREERRGPHIGLWCAGCDRWITWIPQGTPEEREGRRRLAAKAGKPVTDGQRHFLTVTLGVAPGDVPSDRAEASRMIDRILRDRRGGGR